MAKRKRPFYDPAGVDSHIRYHHPGCPVELRIHFVQEIATRRWEKATLGQAFGIVSTNYVRHRMTDYEWLMKRNRLTRDEARLVVAQQVNDILRTWRMGPPPPRLPLKAQSSSAPLLAGELSRSD